MSRPWSAVVFSLGLFALVAQTLLFRSFLTTFEGSELGIGCFFGSWLLWVALGALLGRATSRIAGLRTGHFVTLTLLYLPAFLLQDHWLRSARALAGVGAYEVFELPGMIATSLWVNAPVSLLTGLLFTLACRSAAPSGGLPVARVYVLESLGAFAGGIAVTILLAAGLAEETVFLGAALVLSLAVAAFHGAKRPYLHGVPFLAVTIALLTGLDSRWATAHDEAAWSALLKADDYQGSFATAQGRYLYGQREGQFAVMSWGGVSETLPNTERASEVVALSLAQHPTARRVLVVGPGSLSICRRFAQLPSIERVAWLHPDPDYPDALLARLPRPFRNPVAKLDIPRADVRAFLDRSRGEFDLALLHLPDVTTLLLNRYSTREFYDQLKRALSPGGTVAVRLSGGANYLGSELVYLGASAYLTLKGSFGNVALKPGEESWLIASDGDGPTSSPAMLRDRFAAIDGAATVFPPAALLTLYPPDRIAFQTELYERVAQEAGAEILTNTDARPRALLYGLAVALRQAGRRAVARDVSALVEAGAMVATAGILCFLLVRLYYLLTSSAPRRGLFDGGFLVFSTGMVGMSASVVLMLLYQARYGSLYLHAGLIFSLFMLGLFAGGLLCERVLGRRPSEPRGLLPLLLLAHLLVVAAIAALPAGASRPHFALLFVLSGLFTGIYFPIAAHRMKAAGRSLAAAGARLEFIDHLGGAAGAVLTGLLLLPILGTTASLALLALLVATNFLGALVPKDRGAAAQERTAARLRIAGHAAFGAAAFLLCASFLLAEAETGREGRLLESAAREMSGRTELIRQSAPLSNGSALAYFDVPDDAGGIEGHVFGTSQLASEVLGYAGPITLAVHVDPQGTLLGYRVIRSRETPVYLERLKAWREALTGRNIFGPHAFAGVDALTGATMSSRAILSTLDIAGQRFAADVLGFEVRGPEREPPPPRPDRDFLVLASLTAAAIALRYRPGVWLRRAFLLGTLVLAGLWLNLQFSSQQVFSLLSLQMPSFQLTGGFFVLVVVPVVVLLFGNVYCGYVCPFGALQELLGDLRPRALPTDPQPRSWQIGRAAKYALLALLALLYALARDPAVLLGDPLITFFSDSSAEWIFWFAVAAVALSLVFRRFWCRNLCPAGAFLALLNRVQLLRRIVPRTQPGRCDLGVRSVRDLDCLCCDRCRRETN